MILCQCPHGLVPHCYTIMKSTSCQSGDCVNALTGLCLISTFTQNLMYKQGDMSVNALTGLCLISTQNANLWNSRARAHCVNALTGLCLISTCTIDTYSQFLLGVNALTGLCLISTVSTWVDAKRRSLWCQCPHGLMPHFYIPYFYGPGSTEDFRVNALTGLCLISTG